LLLSPGRSTAIFAAKPLRIPTPPPRFDKLLLAFGALKNFGRGHLTSCSRAHRRENLVQLSRTRPFWQLAGTEHS
jgi:hypothetical protein